MYLDHYKLKEKPFQTSPDPKYVWLGEKYAEALATLEYGIRENIGFLVLTGDVGVGKTAIVNCLLNEIDENVIVAKVSNPDMAPLDFYNFVAAQFKWERSFNRKGKFLVYFEKFLYQIHAEEKKVLLIIDEAQKVRNQLLEEIRLLSNIERDNKKLITIFFVGQSEFQTILFDEQNKALKERIAAWYHIDCLEENETQNYIYHRLKIGGSKNKTFKQDAIKEIYAVTAGNPRQINIICDHALLSGFSSGEKKIDRDVIQECAIDLRIPINDEKRVTILQKICDPPKNQTEESFKIRFTRMPLIFVAVAVIVLIIAGYLFYTFKFDFSQQQRIGEVIQHRSGTDLTKEESLSTKHLSRFTDIPTRLPSENYNRREPQTHIVTYLKEKPKADLKNDLHTDFQNQKIEQTKVNDTEEKLFPKQKLIVYFKLNSDELQDNEYEKLDRIGGFLTINKDYKIYVKGYTDDIGPYNYNLRISEQRGNEVRNYLLNKGVAPSLIEVFGMGSRDPIASNETREGRKINRRVEIGFVRNTTTP